MPDYLLKLQELRSLAACEAITKNFIFELARLFIPNKTVVFDDPMEEKKEPEGLLGEKLFLEEITGDVERLEVLTQQEQAEIAQKQLFVQEELAKMIEAHEKVPTFGKKGSQSLISGQKTLYDYLERQRQHLKSVIKLGI